MRQARITKSTQTKKLPRFQNPLYSIQKNYRKHTNERTSTVRKSFMSIKIIVPQRKKKKRGKRRGEIIEYNKITKGKQTRVEFEPKKQERKGRQIEEEWLLGNKIYIMFYVCTLLTRLGQAVGGRGRPKAVTTIESIYTFVSVLWTLFVVLLQILELRLAYREALDFILHLHFFRSILNSKMKATLK